jgi:hypothetical protein
MGHIGSKFEEGCILLRILCNALLKNEIKTTI